MPCIEIQAGWRKNTPNGRLPGALLLQLLLLLLLTACTNKPAPPPGPTASAPAVAKPAPAVAPSIATPTAPPPAAQGLPASTPKTKTAPAPRYVTLGAAALSRNWAEYRLQAARRLVAAHPDTSHMGKPQPLLLGIPVLEIELNRDGSVRKVTVLREPQEAKETIQLAIDAVHRAGPYGDVTRLPKPWKFIETFLFNSDSRFKPRSLD